MKKIISIVFLFILLVGCTKQQESLYSNKTQYVGDNSKVISIVSQLDYKNMSYDSLEILSEKKPYGLIVNLKSGELDSYNLKKQATLTFSLIDNLEYIEYKSVDDASTITQFNRTDIDEELKINDEKSTSEIGSSEENFNNYLNK